jgi:integrase
MAKILNGDKRGRPGRWLVDYRDGAGIRRLVTVKSRDEAKAALEKVLGESRQQTAPVCDPNITLSAYSARWFEMIATTLKPRTLESYKANFDLHLAPRFGKYRVRAIQTGAVRQHLVGLLADGKKTRGTVGLIAAVLRALLNSAVADGLVTANATAGVGRQLKLATPKKALQDAVKGKALDREQMAAFLAAVEPKYYPLFLTMARTGMRISEVCGLNWPDINLKAREIHIARAISRGAESTPKSGHSRTVDMSEQLAATLAAIRPSDATGPVFTVGDGARISEDWIRGALVRGLKAAGLPRHFTPHSFRHSYGCLLIQQGESPAYVQRQLGHSSIQLTVDVYGSGLPTNNRAAVNRLDDPSGSKVVAGESPIEAEVRAVIDGLKV